MLKVIAVGLWIMGAYANYMFYVAFGSDYTLAVALAVFSQLTFTYLEHMGIRNKKAHNNVVFMSVIIIASMIDVVMTATGLYSGLVNLPGHILGQMIASLGYEISNAFIIILSIVMGTVIALATEIIWNES